MSRVKNNRKKIINLNTVSVSLGCSSCTRPNKLSLLFFNPNKKHKTTPSLHKRHQNQNRHSLSDSSWTNDEYDEIASTTTTTTNSTATMTSSSSSSQSEKSKKKNKKGKKKEEEKEEEREKTGRGFGRVGGEGVAVEKESDDPYLDFRHSMLQMILENQIYSKNDMKDLLNCFLHLNSPSHHAVIVTAFSEIWDGVFSLRSSSNDNDNNNINNNNYYCYNNSFDGNGNGNNNVPARDYYYY